MKLVRPSFEIMAAYGHKNLPYSYSRPLELIEAAGRTCYKSEDKAWDTCPKCGGSGVAPSIKREPCTICEGGKWKTSADKFVDMLRRRGHLAMLEHSWMVRRIRFTFMALRALGSPHSRFLESSWRLMAGNLRAWGGTWKLAWLATKPLENEESIPLSNMPPQLCAMTVKFICDRGVSHELVRHRIASYCLSGNTEVVAFSKHRRSPKRWTMDQLYSWSKDNKRKGRLKLIKLRSVNEHGIIVPNSIKSIISSGPQQLFELSTECGRTIKATANHNFKTPEGWKALKDLSVGEYVIANGIPSFQNKEWIEEYYIRQRMTRPEVAALAGVSDSFLGIWIRKLGIKKPLNLRPSHPGHGVKGMHSLSGRNDIRDRMLGDGNPSWKGALAKKGHGRSRINRDYCAWGCDACGMSGKVEHHHIDGNPNNNDPENIKHLCPICHKAWHIGSAVLTVFKTKITSIRPVGIEETFDIEMEYPYHNFIANGLVVHNSQESTRYCNYAGGVTFVIPPWLDIEPGEWKSSGGMWSQNGEVPSLESRLKCHSAGTSEWARHMLNCEEEYIDLLFSFDGWKPEHARSVLPNSLKTEIVVTASLQEWQHIFKLRCAPSAHPQMRELMVPLRTKATELYPGVFGEG